MEVGTGFHPELTGRENIYLNGAILGMHRHEIKRKFDAIVDFSGIETFLDTPVKRYSSGMYVRLAFAVAAHLDPEILIVDEVLAVGDAEFQKKCLGKMQDVAQSGRTVLFVSHNMDAIATLCTGVVLMVAGRSSEQCDPSEGIHRYLGQSRNSGRGDSAFRLPRAYSNTGIPILSSFLVNSDNGNGPDLPTGDRVIFDLVLKHINSVTDLVCSIALSNSRGQRVVMFHTLYHSGLTFEANGELKLRCVVPSLTLAPGDYTVEVSVGLRDREMLERVENVEDVHIYFKDLWSTGRLPNDQQGNALIPANWSQL